jgi:hypothetical protein
LKNDLLKYTFVELISNNNCYLNQICDNDLLPTYKVIKSFEAFLFEPKIEKVFMNALSQSYLIPNYDMRKILFKPFVSLYDIENDSYLCPIDKIELIFHIKDLLLINTDK